MRTNFKEIFKKIRHKFDINAQVGYTAEDFIMGMSTLRIKARLGNQRMAIHSKFSDQIAEDGIAINKLENELELMVVKPLWRLNQKRVKHGLESWI